MTSSSRVAANRRNARKSTGPRTPAGKLASSRNATTHGLTSRKPGALLPDEQPEDYQAFAAAFVADLAPEGPLECFHAERAVSAAWRLARVPRVEAAVLEAARAEEARDDAREDMAEGAARFFRGSTEAVAQRLREEGELPDAVSWARHLRGELDAKGPALIEEHEAEERKRRRGRKPKRDDGTHAVAAFEAPVLNETTMALERHEAAEAARRGDAAMLGRSFLRATQAGALATLGRYEAQLARELDRSLEALAKAQGRRRGGAA